MRLLSVDPGSSEAHVSHTGVVLLSVPEDGPPELVDSWAVDSGLLGFRRWYLDYQATFTGVDVVVCEKFVNRNIMGAALSPLLIEGAIRSLRPDTVLQPASGKNTAVTNQNLSNLGLGKENFVGDWHGDRTESARHAIWYLRKKRHRPTLRKGWPDA